MILDLHDATDAAQAVMHDFNVRKKAIESVMIIIKRYQVLSYQGIISCKIGRVKILELAISYRLPGGPC